MRPTAQMRKLRWGGHLLQVKHLSEESGMRPPHPSGSWAWKGDSKTAKSDEEKLSDIGRGIMDSQPRFIPQSHSPQRPSQYPVNHPVTETHSLMVILTVFVAMGTRRQHQYPSQREQTVHQNVADTERGTLHQSKSRELGEHRAMWTHL